MICEDSVYNEVRMRAREWCIVPWKPLWGHVLDESSCKWLYSPFDASLLVDIFLRGNKFLCT